MDARKRPRDRGSESKLARLRIAAQLTQRQLAEELGVNVLTVQRWESGANCPPSKHLRALSALLSCQIDDLI